MSFEGYWEYLCENGHYRTVSPYTVDVEETETCSCGRKFEYRHLVDETNGIDENDPSTMPAPKTEYQYDNIWRKDHLGNDYAVKRIKYKPVEHWSKI